MALLFLRVPRGKELEERPLGIQRMSLDGKLFCFKRIANFQENSYFALAVLREVK
jgi:hypothetical protein